jgi:hypothetical protein
MYYSAFFGYLYILDLMNAWKMEHTLYFIPPPTSYLAESCFNWLTYLMWKICNQLDVVKRADLRLSLATLWQLDIQKLVFVKPKEQIEYNANF